METMWQNASNSSNSSQPDKYHNDSVESITFSCFLNFVLLVIALLSFAALLLRPAAAKCLAPRLAERGQGLPRFPLGWLRLAVCSRCFLDEVGMDGLVVIRFCDLGLKFSLCAAAICMGLVPVYASANCGSEGFSKYSLSNLSCSPTHFWPVVLAAYLVNAVFMHLMVVEWRTFTALRRTFYNKAVQGAFGAGAAQALRSILVEGIPDDMQSAAETHAFFERIFGIGSVYSTVLQSKTGSLHSLKARQSSSSCFLTASAKERLDTRMQQELSGVKSDVSTGGVELEAMRSRSSSFGRRQTTYLVDDQPLLQSVNFASVARGVGRNVRDYSETAVNVMGALPGSELVPGLAGGTSTAFVTLSSVKDRVVAEQLVLSHKANLSIEAAPEARDIIWPNAASSLQTTRLRNMSAVAGCIAGVILWWVPVSALQLWTNASNLSKWVPGVDTLSRYQPVLYTFLVKYMPVVTLMVLLSVLPYIFEMVAKRYEKQKVKSKVHRIVLNRYFGYLMATLYVTVFSSSIWSSLEQILDHPANFFDILRQTIPSVAVYFITFVLARFGISLPILLFFPGICTPPVNCYFATEAADPALILVLGATYSFIAPCILPACALYFAFASVVYRWLFLYVYSPEFESAGSFWYDLFNCAMLGLLLGDVSLMALAANYCGIRSQSFDATAVLTVAVLAFRTYCTRRYALPSQHMALDDAAAVEMEERENALASLGSSYYMDPVLKS